MVQQHSDYRMTATREVSQNRKQLCEVSIKQRAKQCSITFFIYICLPKCFRLPKTDK